MDEGDNIARYHQKVKKMRPDSHQFQTHYTDKDILCGRGAWNKRPANIMYWMIIANSFDEYCWSPASKSHLKQIIYMRIRGAQLQFLKPVPSNRSSPSRWRRLTPKEALKKISDNLAYEKKKRNKAIPSRQQGSSILALPSSSLVDLLEPLPLERLSGRDAHETGTSFNNEDEAEDLKGWLRGLF